jgi:hypothetical protein
MTNQSSINPFTITDKIGIIGNRKVVNTKDGIIIKDYGIYNNSFVPTDNSLRLFRTKRNKEIINNLNGYGKTLLWYIMFNVKMNEDKINLNSTNLKDFNKTSTFLSKGISNLKANNIIARVGKTGIGANNVYMYWINPTIFFYGGYGNKYYNAPSAIITINYMMNRYDVNKLDEIIPILIKEHKSTNTIIYLRIKNYNVDIKQATINVLKMSILNGEEFIVHNNDNINTIIEDNKKIKFNN